MNFSCWSFSTVKIQVCHLRSAGDGNHFFTLANVRLEDDEAFASDMTDIGLQFHEPDVAPAPVTILSLVLQEFGIIESRAE